MLRARHDPRDRLTIIFIARAPILKERVDPLDTLGPLVRRLQTQRDTVIGECELCVPQRRHATEIAWRYDPHPIECPQRIHPLGLGPRLVGKEVSAPQHYAESEILLAVESRPGLLDVGNASRSARSVPPASN